MLRNMREGQEGEGEIWKNYNILSYNHHMCAGAPWLCRHTRDAS